MGVGVQVSYRDNARQTRRSGTAKKLAVEPVLSLDHGHSLDRVDLADMAAQVRVAA
jgi:hypothetical protein